MGCAPQFHMHIRPGAAGALHRVFASASAAHARRGQSKGATSVSGASTCSVVHKLSIQNQSGAATNFSPTLCHNASSPPAILTTFAWAPDSKRGSQPCTQPAAKRNNPALFPLTGCHSTDIEGSLKLPSNSRTASPDAARIALRHRDTGALAQF